MRDVIGIILSQGFIKIFSHVTVISDKAYNEILYWLRNGRKPDIDNPNTFNEHVLAIKITEDGRSLTKYTDKLQVRGYVERMIGSQYLVPVLGIWEKARTIDFDSLPSQYILKTNHGSGWNYIVHDSNQVRKNEVISYFSKAIKSNYYYKSREKNYKYINPKIICEKLLVPQNENGLIDVKFFCFIGRAEFYAISYENSEGRHYGLLEINGEEIPIESHYLKISQIVPAYIIKKMISLSEKLAAPFKFVRVDFYLSDDDVYFSELTFHSGGGIRPIHPVEVDRCLGKYFKGEKK